MEVMRHGTERTTRPVAEVDALLDQQRILRWHQHQAAQQTAPQGISTVDSTTGSESLLADGVAHVSSINPNSPPALAKRRLRGNGNHPHPHQQQRSKPLKLLTAPDGTTPLSAPLPEHAGLDGSSLPDDVSPSLLPLPLDRPEPRGESGYEEREGRW